MGVVLLIELVTDDGAYSNLHKTNTKVSVSLYSNMCVASCQFNSVLSGSICLDISSFCYSDSLTRVSGDGFPPTPGCKLSALSSGARCGSGTLVPAWSWLCHARCRGGRWWGSGWRRHLPSGGRSACSAKLRAQVRGPAESWSAV